MLKQHQREQRNHLRLARHQPVQKPTQLDRRLRQLVTDQDITRSGEVALIEDEVDHHESCFETTGELVPGRNPKRNTGPAQPLGHGLLGDEKRIRDLTGRQPTQGAQSQRHLLVHGECRMTAREDHLESVVMEGGAKHRRFGTFCLDLFQTGQQLLFPGIRLLASDSIDGPVPGHRGDPAGRIGRHTRVGPSAKCVGERILNGLLRQVDIPQLLRQIGQHQGVGLPEGTIYCFVVVGQGSQRALTWLKVRRRQSRSQA